MRMGTKVKNRKNHVIFTYQKKSYRYDDIYNLIKIIKYDTAKICDYKVIEVTDENDKDAICILFQQTHGKLDWLHNLAFSPLPKWGYKGHEFNLLYHRGFYLEYKYARDKILQNVSELLKGHVKKIFVSGWSLGGSIAPICAEDIYYTFGIKPTLITFEGANPCFGFHTRNRVKNSIADDSICFVYGKDVVSRVPPFAFGFIKLYPYIYYLKEKKRLPWLFPIIRSIYYFFKDTYRTHTQVDIGIKKLMP